MSAVSVALGSLPSWERVTVYRLDAQGKPITEKSKDSAGNPVVRNREYTFIKDVETGELYWNEEGYIVALKCALMALNTPLYVAGYTLWNGIKISSNLIKTLGPTLQELGQRLKEGRWQEARSLVHKGVCVQIPAATFTHIRNIVKSPLFAIGLAIASLYGIIDPFRGRAIVAKLEHEWQNRVSYKQDLRETPALDTGNAWRNFIDSCALSEAFYCGWCFQPRGVITDTTKFQLV